MRLACKGRPRLAFSNASRQLPEHNCTVLHEDVACDHVHKAAVRCDFYACLQHGCLIPGAVQVLPTKVEMLRLQPLDWDDRGGSQKYSIKVPIFQ